MSSTIVINIPDQYRAETNNNKKYEYVILAYRCLYMFCKSIKTFSALRICQKKTSLYNTNKQRRQKRSTNHHVHVLDLFWRR